MKIVVLSLFVLLSANFASAQLALETVVNGLDQPLMLTAPEGDAERLFIVERRGAILIVENGVLLPDAFLDIADRAGEDEALNQFGLAFHPNYATNGFFVVHYAVRVGDISTNFVSRFSVVGDPLTSNVADAMSELVLISFEATPGDHNGGSILFGPNDGYLYIPTGDGGCCNDPFARAQDRSLLLGKILRIDIDQMDPGLPYAIPSDNPFIGDPSARGEIWAVGLRNPFRSSFDRDTGDFYVGDVGQDQREEINFQPANSMGGENYGWAVFEGTRCNTEFATQQACDDLAPEVTFPIHEVMHPDGQSITGGFVYRGSAIANLSGTYFFGDFVTSRVWSFRYDGATITEFQERTLELDPLGTLLGGIVSISEDGLGELYICNIQGRVEKIVGPSISVTRPNGGETFVKGTVEEITWDSTGTIENVEILIRLSNKQRTISPSTLNDGSFDWTVPSNLPNRSIYFVEVRDASNNSISDTSDGLFTIEEDGGGGGSATIMVTRPNGGEVFVKNTVEEITWTSTGSIANVRITLRLGGKKRVLANSTPNDGSFDWTVLPNFPNRSTYFIEIRDAVNSSVIDLSDGLFTIQE